MYILIVILILIVIATVIEMIREQFVFKVRHYEIHSSKLNNVNDELKIVFISDLHGHEYGQNNCRLLQSISEIQPDLILSGGDMIVGKKDYDCTKVIRFVRELCKIAPVFCANGNHEERMKLFPEKYGNIYEPYKQELLKAGVTCIENESCVFNKNNISIVVTGVELPMECYAHRGLKKIKTEQITEKIGYADETKYNILLAHHPAYMEHYKEWGADLTLSGHLHGGVVRIPGLGGVVSPQMGLFPKYSGGYFSEGRMDFVVSRGLGTHTINVRLFNQAELIVLHVKGEK